MKQNSYALIVFDWDGTLSNSISRIVESMQIAIDQMQWPDRDEESIRNIIGLGLPEALRALYPEISSGDLEQMRANYSQQFIKGYTTPSPLYEGVEETLAELQAKGYMLAVATGKSRRGMNRIFADTPWGNYFAGSRCADETQSKPHPQMLYELMEQAQVTPRQTLMVGDTEFDLEMASNAGVDSIGVSYGVHDVPRLQRHGPELVVDCISELLPWLAQR